MIHPMPLVIRSEHEALACASDLQAIDGYFAARDADCEMTRVRVQSKGRELIYKCAPNVAHTFILALHARTAALAKRPTIESEVPLVQIIKHVSVSLGDTAAGLATIAKNLQQAADALASVAQQMDEENRTGAS